MKRLILIAILIILSPVLVPRLSGIGYEEPANGAQAWAYVRQGALRVPDLMPSLTDDERKEDGNELAAAAAVLAADSPGPATLTELFTALNHARTGFMLLETYYPTAIQEAKMRQQDYDKKAQECQRQTVMASQEKAKWEEQLASLGMEEAPGANRPEETNQRRRNQGRYSAAQYKADKSEERNWRRQELADEVAQYEQELADINRTLNSGKWVFNPNATILGRRDVLIGKIQGDNAKIAEIDQAIVGEQREWLAGVRAQQQELQNAWQASAEAYQVALLDAQRAISEAESNRHSVADMEARPPLFAQRREACADFYQEVCKRVRLMTWKEPMAKEYPELGTEALHPRYVVGNACVFAKHAQEPWLRHYAIEQLAHWKAFYPEAQATLESIRDDGSDALASLAGEQLAGNK